MSNEVSAPSADLERLLQALQDGTAGPEDLELLDSLLEGLRGHISQSSGADGELRLIEELRELARFIQSARNELASLRPRDIQERFLPTAADELDAIVQSTETATHEIMDAAEALDGLMDSLTPEQADVLMGVTTRIYEACTFQDITGQRITKVVRTLKSIEERVDALVNAFDKGAPKGIADGAEGDDLNRFRTSVAAVGDQDGDKALLNGPGQAAAAMDQSAIDALLKDF